MSADWKELGVIGTEIQRRFERLEGAVRCLKTVGTCDPEDKVALREIAEENQTHGQYSDANTDNG
ncbi:MAG: hypothetical protein Q7T05_03990 [Dehalococcoidia bacterium]|nr:hypothetical protein [Dehalococcoidia bacterium]